MKRISGNNRWI